MEATPEIVRTHLPEVDWIEDGQIREKVIRVWVEVCRRSKWPNPFTMGFTEGVAEPTLAEHIRGTVHCSVAVTKALERVHGLRLEPQTLIILGLLHDASKPLEYEPGENGLPVKTLGKRIQHGFYAAHLALEQGLPEEFVHLILTHTPQSTLKPQTIEGILFHYVDLADARIIGGLVK